jgi:hypothetical protein
MRNVITGLWKPNFKNRVLLYMQELPYLRTVKLKILIRWLILTNPKKLENWSGFAQHDVRTKTGRFSQKSENCPTLFPTTWFPSLQHSLPLIQTIHITSATWQNHKGQSEPAPTSAPCRMDGKWSGNSFLLGSSHLSNHCGYLNCFFLPTINAVGSKNRPDSCINNLLT